MKKFMIVMVAVAGLFAGCGQQSDMSSPPAGDAGATNAASTNAASTNR